MEGLPIGIIISIIIAVIYIISAVANSGESKRLAEQIGQFKFNVIQSYLDDNGTKRPSFSMSFSGPVQSFRPNTPMRVMVHVYDLTDGSAEPVLSMVDSLQTPDSIVFEFASAEQVLPDAGIYSLSNEHFFHLPADFLKFQRKGKRRLKFQLDIIDASNPPNYQSGYLLEAREGSVLAFDTFEMDYENHEFGYEDQRENRDKLHGYAIELAYAMSAIDGDIDDDEVNVIRDWAMKHVNYYETGSDRHTEENQRFEQLLKHANERAHQDQQNLDTILDNIKQVADTGDRYDCLELCLLVASADGVADDSELALVDRIAESLELDRQKMRDMQDKILPITIYSNEVDETSTDGLLGITPDMDKNAIRRHLLTEYSKWNNMASHKDPERREQAEKMLQLIAETRKKHS